MEQEYWVDNFPKFDNCRVSRFTPLISPNMQKQDTAKEKFEKKSKFQQYIVWIFHIFNVGNGITVLGGHFFQN